MPSQQVEGLPEVLHKPILRSTKTNKGQDMSSTNPRISVTLKPKTAAVLRRLSAITGNSVSSIVGDLLEDSEAVLERAALTIEAGAQAMAEARAKLAAEQAATQKAIQDRFFGLEDADLTDNQPDLLEGAERIQRRASRVVQPPSLTGGSQTLAAPRSTTGKPAAKPSPARKGGKNGAV
jgi:hypothetical protein